MGHLTQNEIIALLHLAESKQTEVAPKGLTAAQYTVALKTLNKLGMAKIAQIEGGEIEDAKIALNGQAVVDDLNAKRKLILRKILDEKDLSLDQYNIMVKAMNENVDYNFKSSEISWQEYRNVIIKPLEQKSFVFHDTGKKYTVEVFISHKGKDVVEGINDEVNFRLAKEIGTKWINNQKDEQTANDLESSKDETYMDVTLVHEDSYTVNDLRRQIAELTTINANLQDKINQLKEEKTAPYEEQALIKFGQGKNAKIHYTTAKTCANIVKRYRLLEKEQANILEKMLSEITGLNATSFHRYMR